MSNAAQIEKINYFGEETGSSEWNAKVLYRVNGRLHHALIYVCYWSKRFYISKMQFNECKVYASLGRALVKYSEHYFSI